MSESSGVRAILEAIEAEPRAQGWQCVVAGRLVEVHRGKELVLLAHRGDPFPDVIASHADGLRDGRVALLIVGEGESGPLEAHLEGCIVGILPTPIRADPLYYAVHGLLERVRLHGESERRAASMHRYRYELGELVQIAKALTQERDIDRLLDLILQKSRFVCGADAGSIYIVDGDAEAQRLHFKLSQNESCDFESSEFTMPVSTRSIAGYAVVTRRPISIPNVDDIPEDAPYGFDGSFDRKVGYRTISMITVPMVSAEDEVMGVIQLINKKRDPNLRLLGESSFEEEVIPFDERSGELLQTLASQAGIALENALLYDEIRRIFEGFVRASVQAIEQRDPTTSGHSQRVSMLSCALAKQVDRVGEGPYRDTSFHPREIKELEYASLLHDFGKIGVREEVLVKAKKLYPHSLASVRERIFFAIKAAEVERLEQRLARVVAGAGASDLNRIDEIFEARRAQLDGALRFILEANEPTVLSEGDFSRVLEIAAITYVDGEGTTRRLLDVDEVRSLQVRRGSLNDTEMDEIRSHVVPTRNFLGKIPWGKSFAAIPEIAGAHHEKLDGRGYPRGLRAEGIPLPSKIMTIADIYDALTARDRPYKRAVPIERALAILDAEVKGGGIDPDLVRIFQEASIYRVVQGDLSERSG